VHARFSSHRPIGYRFVGSKRRDPAQRESPSQGAIAGPAERNPARFVPSVSLLIDKRG